MRLQNEYKIKFGIRLEWMETMSNWKWLSSWVNKQNTAVVDLIKKIEWKTITKYRAWKCETWDLELINKLSSNLQINSLINEM